ncbi:MAG: GHKL domain-containing protein [Ruminococcus sp.]|nr:GHKL domain-containing protein [Ruminococcus sp.]
MIWIAVEIIAILAECLIITRLLVNYFGLRKPEKKVLHTSILALCLIAVDLIGTFVIKEELFFITCFIPGAILLSLLLLKGNVFEKIFVNILNYIMVYFSTLPFIFLLTHLTQKDVDEFAFQSQDAVRSSSILMTKIIFFILTQAVLWFHKKEQYRFKKAEWIIIISAFSTTLLIGLGILLLASGSTLSPYLYIAITIMLCMLDIIVFVFLQKLNAVNRQENMQKMLEFQMAQQQNEIEQLDKQYHELSILRHDFKNQIECIRSLLLLGDTQKALDYTNTLTERKLGIAEQHVQCSSSVVNAVINAKFNEAQKHRIETSCRMITHVPEHLEFDVSVLLSNLLDNALEACKLQEADTKLTVSFTEKGGYYRLVVQNTIQESVLSKNKMLETSKENRLLHGWGLKSVKDIAASHKGSVDFYEKEGTFIVSVLLMKQEN